MASHPKRWFLMGHQNGSTQEDRSDAWHQSSLVSILRCAHRIHASQERVYRLDIQARECQCRDEGGASREKEESEQTDHLPFRREEVVGDALIRRGNAGSEANL